MLNQDPHDFSNTLFEQLSNLGHWELMINEQVANRECSLSAPIEGERIRRKLKLRNQDAEPFLITVGHALRIFCRRDSDWSFVVE